MPWSTIWMLISISGGLLLAFATWRYNENIGIENKAEAEIESGKIRDAQNQQMLALLRPEISRNKTEVEVTLAALKTNSKTISKLHSTAWSTISGSGLITNIPPDQLSKLLETYQLVNALNELYERITDLDHGVSSALQNSPAKKLEYFDMYAETAQRLLPLLNTN